MNSFVKARTLSEYPLGAHRWSLLMLTVLASILGAYDFQLAPLLPILLPYLHMSHLAYGAFVTFAVLISGISAFFGGPLADRYGRVLIIDICLGLVTVLLFLNVLITGIVSFVILRTLMGIVAGLTAGAGAALVRDMSPRLSRALAFGLLTIGPVGANFLSNYVAGATLPIYHTWQSQIWIMGFFAVAMYIPIVLWLCDLSPELRMQIMKTEIQALAAEGAEALDREIQRQVRGDPDHKQPYFQMTEQAPESVASAGREFRGSRQASLSVVDRDVERQRRRDRDPSARDQAEEGPSGGLQSGRDVLEGLRELRRPRHVGDREEASHQRRDHRHRGAWKLAAESWNPPRHQDRDEYAAEDCDRFARLQAIGNQARDDQSAEIREPEIFVHRRSFGRRVMKRFGEHQWGEWVKVALGGMIIYIVAMAFTRGHAAAEEHPAQAPVTGKATAS